MKKNNKIKIILPALLVASMVLIGILLWNFHNLQKKPNNSEDKTNKYKFSHQMSKQSESSTTQGSGTARNSSQASEKGKIVPPKLSMSSGNNSYVAPGTEINFICNHELGFSCNIILQSESQKIVLGPKDISDNGRGSFFASFYWKALSGSYTVFSQVFNHQGESSISNQIRLDVQ